jgi:hypothetical protein
LGLVLEEEMENEHVGQQPLLVFQSYDTKHLTLAIYEKTYT